MTEGSGDTENLRLPVPFFDLLMTLLICFLVFVAPAQDASIRSIDIPVARSDDKPEGKTLLAVIPHRDSAGWTFEMAIDGRRLPLDALVSFARAENRKVVIVAHAATPLQDFVELQTELRRKQLEFGLAVRKTSQEVKP